VWKEDSLAGKNRHWIGPSRSPKFPHQKKIVKEEYFLDRFKKGKKVVRNDSGGESKKLETLGGSIGVPAPTFKEPKIGERSLGLAR